MSPLDLLFLLRRHKWVLIVAVVVGLAAGWLTAPGTSIGPQQYEATNTLIVNPQAQAASPNLDQVALLATKGAVPQQAADALHVPLTRITSAVSATSNLQAASLTITAHGVDRTFTEDAANAVANAVVAQVAGSNTTTYDQKVAELNREADQLRARIAAGGSGTAAAAEVAAAQAQLAATNQQIGLLTTAGPPPAALVSVDKATAHRAHKKGFSAPDSKPERAVLLAGFGLLIGLGAVFALDRLDTRIHTKGSAEAAFGYPVIAEIPPLPAGSQRELLSESHPGSPFVEAYRGLRTHLALAGPEHGLRAPGPGNGAIILITSPLAGEGKTTSVGHVAAMLGEVGRSVLVVSADFRRPRLHDLFHRERTPGLGEVLGGAPDAPDVADLDLRTPVTGVQFIASGAAVSNPAVVIKRTPGVLKAAQPFWEFILVDSAPLLVANDSSDLARAANGVIVMARSGRTTIDAAERTAALLQRLEAPVLGVVLIAANESPTAYRYYRTQYYADHNEDERSHWWQRRRRHRDAPARPAARGANGKNGSTGWVPSDRPADKLRS
jgi:Mrp family chromosome partitioning ATPase/capsular polysaccharide biosynthesis protein